MKRTLIAAVIFCGMMISAADLTTKSGKVYENYELVNANDKGIVIMHDTGSSTIPLADWPDSKKVEAQNAVDRYKRESARRAEAIQRRNEEKAKRAAVKPTTQETPADTVNPSEQEISSDAVNPSEQVPAWPVKQAPATPAAQAVSVRPAAQVQTKAVIKPLPLISMTAVCAKCNIDRTSWVKMKYPRQYTPTNIEGPIKSKTVTRRGVPLNGKCSCGFGKAKVTLDYGFNQEEE